MNTHTEFSNTGGDREMLDAELEVNEHARRLSEALEGLRWGLSRTSQRVELFKDRARHPVDFLRGQPLYVSLPIIAGSALALFFGGKALFFRKKGVLTLAT